MINYIFYNKITGEVFSEHSCTTEDLTQERQELLLKNQYGMTGELSSYGMLVSEGYNAVDIYSMITARDGKKFIDPSGV